MLIVGVPGQAALIARGVKECKEFSALSLAHCRGEVDGGESPLVRRGERESACNVFVEGGSMFEDGPKAGVKLGDVRRVKGEEESGIAAESAGNDLQGNAGGSLHPMMLVGEAIHLVAALPN